MRMRIRFLIAAFVIPLVAGCAAAAAGAAGAAGAIAYNERGAESQVESTVAVVEQATENVYADLGLAITDRDVESDEVELTGRSGDMRVVVDIEDEGNGLTSIEVTAREGTLDYDRDYAEDVLRRILRAI